MCLLIHTGRWSVCPIEEAEAPQKANPEGQRKTEAAGLKAHQAPEGESWRQIKPLTKIKIAFLFQKYFSWWWKLWRQWRRKDGQWSMMPLLCMCSGFSHSERSAETSTQHLQQGSKVHVNWYEQMQRKERTNIRFNNVDFLKDDTDP